MLASGVRFVDGRPQQRDGAEILKIDALLAGTDAIETHADLLNAYEGVNARWERILAQTAAHGFFAPEILGFAFESNPKSRHDGRVPHFEQFVVRNFDWTRFDVDADTVRFFPAFKKALVHTYTAFVTAFRVHALQPFVERVVANATYAPALYITAKDWNLLFSYALQGDDVPTITLLMQLVHDDVNTDDNAQLRHSLMYSLGRLGSRRVLTQVNPVGYPDWFIVGLANAQRDAEYAIVYDRMVDDVQWFMRVEEATILIGEEHAYTLFLDRCRIYDAIQFARLIVRRSVQAQNFARINRLVGSRSRNIRFMHIRDPPYVVPTRIRMFTPEQEEYIANFLN